MISLLEQKDHRELSYRVQQRQIKMMMVKTEIKAKVVVRKTRVIDYVLIGSQLAWRERERERERERVRVRVRVRVSE